MNTLAPSPVKVGLFLCIAALLGAPAVQAQALTQVQSLGDTGGGTVGLSNTEQVIVSPDGRHLYACAGNDDALAVYARHPRTGALTFAQRLVDTERGGTEPALDACTDLAFSPDGRHVYVTSRRDDALSVYARNPATGTLSLVEALVDEAQAGGTEPYLNSARGLAVSPDGRHVYATADVEDALSVYRRDAHTGQLTRTQVLLDEAQTGGTVAHFDSPFALVMSPDGAYLYVTARNDDALHVYARDAETGLLTHQSALVDDEPLHLAGILDIALSPGGDFLYVTADADDALSVFGRDGTDGSLAFVQAVVDDAQGGEAPYIDFAGFERLVVTSAHVMVSSHIENAVSVFSRAANGGTLAPVYAYANTETDGDDAVQGPRSAVMVGDMVYLGTSRGDGLSVLTFDANAAPGSSVPQAATAAAPAVQAEVTGSDVVLTWQGATDAAPAGFEVEQRIDANWNTLVWMDPTGEVLTYRIANVAPGRHPFRIKQIELDGTFTYSATVEANVELPGAAYLSAVYPNPFRGAATSVLMVKDAQHVRVDVVDLLGRSVAVLYDDVLPADVSHRMHLDTAGLSDGTYLLRAAGETFTTVRKLTVLR